MAEEKSNKITRLIIALSIGLGSCLPLTGFIYGMYACQDCGTGVTGVLGRIIIGFVHVFLTIITLGVPPNNEGGASGTNLRLYVFITFVVVSALTYLIIARKKDKTK